MVKNKRNIITSIQLALKGVSTVFRTERNFKIQLAIGILVFLLCLLLPLARWEIAVIILLIFGVLIMEMVNTALEKFNDLLKPRLHHYVYDVKNMMAGAVLLVSIGSIIIGLYIFLPHLNNLLERGII